MFQELNTMRDKWHEYDREKELLRERQRKTGNYSSEYYDKEIEKILRKLKL
jgi:uncharacterized membrane protein